MAAYLQVWNGSEPAAIPLSGDGLVVGRDAGNDVVVDWDQRVSRVHAALHRYASGWTIRDLGSGNGTFVNGEQVTGERSLRPGDEITVGSTRIVYRADVPVAADRTVTVSEPRPDLTRRERDVLVALCRPLVGPGQFAQPATIAEVAEALVVSRAAVTFHLDNLYAKFNVTASDGASRRVQLANAALSSGAVTRTELRAAEPPAGQ